MSLKSLKSINMFRMIHCRLLQNTSSKIQAAFFCNENGKSIISNNEPIKQSGFAKSYEKFDDITKVEPSAPETFESLLRNSKFIDLGDPIRKIVIGKVFHVVEDDLYIDFGWKFHCVCTRPKKNSSEYIRGAKVRLQIKDLELSSKFLGYEKDLTLLEADCSLLGLAQEKSIKVSS